MQNLFLNYICKISAQIVMTLLFNTLNKSKSWILKAKIYAHQRPVKIITSTRNLIEIVLSQDYSLRYSADQSSTGCTYALLCRQGGKHSVINSIPAENLRPLPISSFAKRHFYTKC